MNFLAMFWENTISSLCAAVLSFCVANDDLPKDQFLVVSGWPAIQQDISIGQATGIDVDSLNRVFVFHRARREWQEPIPIEPISADTIFVLDGDKGTLLDSWGAGHFIMPHGLSVDADDNVWVTDVGSHQVHKFSADGNLLLTLGQLGEQGRDAFRFARPTDIAFAKGGEVYVSDGYINTRVIKFSKDGTFLLEWGVEGDGPGQFNLPHGISTDDQGFVYVADRNNSRLQVFDAEGVFIEEWERALVGRPYGVDVAPSGDIFVIDGGDQPFWTKARVRKFDEEGSLVALLDLVPAGESDVLGHDIAVGPDGAIYVVDAWGNSVQKLMPN